jgi:hypothetical protein
MLDLQLEPLGDVLLSPGERSALGRGWDFVRNGHQHRVWCYPAASLAPLCACMRPFLRLLAVCSRSNVIRVEFTKHLSKVSANAL